MSFVNAECVMRNAELKGPSPDSTFRIPNSELKPEVSRDVSTTRTSNSKLTKWNAGLKGPSPDSTFRIPNSELELLAPAGSFEALKAAVEAGANAVYLAGSHFGARAFAGNFSNDELIKAVEFAHLRRVKVHVTVNTIVADEEFEALASYLKFLEEINVDAVLVQDLGVASLARQAAPNLVLHASTQMTVHSLEGVKALEKLGFERVVLSRELSISEIKYICANAKAEIEVFMHGALCVCYSGQCLMSSMIGARSGNRGRCAQPCRLPYSLVDDKGVDLLNGKAGQYLLSPKDLNTIDLLPQLIEAGVSSLKIEGRMKRPEYVAVVVETYRNAIDRYFASPSEYQPTTQEHQHLAQIFNRDFTTAYLERVQGKDMISDMRPNNRGLLIGRVLSVGKDQFKFRIPNCAFRINEGDQLEIWVKVGGRVTITVKDFHIDKDVCTINASENLRGVKVHDRVFKVFDAQLTAHARRLFTSAAPIRKIPIVGEVNVKLGQPLMLKFSIADDDKSAQVCTNFIAEPAKNQPLTEEIIAKQLKRLGSSVFELVDCHYDIDDNVMIPISEINEARRQAVFQLGIRNSEFGIGARSNSQFGIRNSQCPIQLGIRNSECVIRGSGVRSSNSAFRITHFALLAHVDAVDKLTVSVESGADSILFGGETYNHRSISPEEYQQAVELAHSAGKRIYIAAPRIVRDSEQAALEEILQAASNADGVYVHNIAVLNLVQRLTCLPVRSDFSLIAFNSETINFLKSMGVESVTLSPELTLEQVKSIVKQSPLPTECIIHGRTELMISSYCAAGSFMGGVGQHRCSEPCSRYKFLLRDRKAALFPVVTDQFCRMHILNSKPLSMLPHVKTLAQAGVSTLRVDGRFLSARELGKAVGSYCAALNGESLEEDFEFTRGHYFRGII